MRERTDILMIVPFEHRAGLFVDASARQTLGGHLFGPLIVALSRLEEYVGFHLNLAAEDTRPVFGGQPLTVASHRSLTAVTLATHLERAGLKWVTLDPGMEDLHWWRVRLRKLRHLQPRSIGLSTTYIMSSPWLRVLLSIIRETFPDTPIILGGYYYATDAKDFLSVDADIFCVGEGETRLVQIVEAIRDGKPLDAVPGLFLRHGNRLRNTGTAEPLNLSVLPAVDWSLSSRIDPPVDIARDMVEMGLETQRGCVFKCGFCTFRTITSPNVMSADVAEERIFSAGSARYATIMMTDATATYPHRRWNEIMTRIIERGGSPHPIWAYARVNDLPEETVDLMARAGVKQVFIGQESGDQAVLNRMHKGTNLTHVQPAVDALARHNMTAVMGFIHGYPGETLETIRRTRDLLVNINKGHEARPPVVLYTLSPFYLQDMAGASRDEASIIATEGDHFFDYKFGGFTSKLLAEECLTTIIAAGRNPSAPAFLFLLGKEKSTSNSMILGGHLYPQEVFRWVKTIEQGLVQFLQNHVEGTPLNDAELRRIKETLISFYPQQRRLANRLKAPFLKQSLHNQTFVVRKLAREWAAEEKSGVGPFTRLMTASMAYWDMGKLASAVRAWRSGAYVSPGWGSTTRDVDQAGSIAAAAQSIVDEGFLKGREKMKVFDGDGNLVQLPAFPSPPPRTAAAMAGSTATMSSSTAARAGSTAADDSPLGAPTNA